MMFAHLPEIVQTQEGQIEQLTLSKGQKEQLWNPLKPS